MRPYRSYLEEIEADVAGLAAVLRSAPADLRVPTCPAWSLAELGAHAGDFAAFYSHAVCDSTGAIRPPWPNTWRHASASPLDGQSPATYFEDRAHFLLELLRVTAPDAEVRTWAPNDQRAHFVARRSAHELSIHRFDAQLAAGDPRPVSAGLAADGIEEMFVMLEHFGVGHGGGSGERLLARSTDEPRSWLIVIGVDHVEVTRVPAPADLEVSGSTSDLELLLYGRPPNGVVPRLGDPAVLETWYRAFTFT